MTIYYMHHIIPRHMGGTDDPSNLKKVTLSEHAEEHRKLWETHGNIKDKIAWLGLTGQIDKEGMIKMLQREGGKKRKGVVVTDEARENIRKAALGRKHSDASKKKMSEQRKGKNHPMYGKPVSVEMRKKLSDANKGKHDVTPETREKLRQARLDFISRTVTK